MRETIMHIKSCGYDVVIDKDYDIAGELVSEMLRDYDGGFTDAGFSVPERIDNGEIARADGYQIREGYYGGNFTYDKVKQGDELRSKDWRRYELVSYGEYNDDAMDEILERINHVWDTEYYSVRVIGLEGEILDMLYGLTLDTIGYGTKLDIIEEIIEHGVEIPEEMLEGLNQTSWSSYTFERGLRSDAFKQYLRDRGIYFEPSQDGEYIHFEVKNADEAVDRRANEIVRQ